MADWRYKLKRRDDGFPRIMGVVNVTPDSFHPDSRSNNLESAVTRAKKMVEEGAEWLDIGGESTRPGSEPVSTEEELRRVIPVIERVRFEIPEVCISVDTRRSSVARKSLEAGADLVNDVSSLGDPEMIEVVASFECPICVMHMQGKPENMQNDPRYGNVVEEVREFLSETCEKLLGAGIKHSQIVVDPGIGFGKKLEHNLALLSSGRGIVPDERLGLLWGVSRKRMFWDLLGRENSGERLSGTLGIASRAPEKGVDIIRVHDVSDHSDLYSAMSAIG
tara:strand:- start:153 stop:986 length:834 start_codon:yes stop_codon:yes gene_type:complete